MIYVITENNDVIFATHIREEFEDYIDGLCIKYYISQSRFDAKVKSLKEFNIDYGVFSPTFEEE